MVLQAVTLCSFVDGCQFFRQICCLHDFEFNSSFKADQHCSQPAVQEGLDTLGQCPHMFQAVCALTLFSVFFVYAVGI